MSLFGGGNYFFAPIFQSDAPEGGPLGLFADASAGFHQEFSAPNPSLFENDCGDGFPCENTDFFLDPSVISSVDNPDTQDYEIISYDLSETFYYAPATDISEPASAGLLLVGCIGSIAIAKFRGHKQPG